jgi:hypothetical protein
MPLLEKDMCQSKFAYCGIPLVFNERTIDGEPSVPLGGFGDGGTGRRFELF